MSHNISRSSRRLSSLRGPMSCDIARLGDGPNAVSESPVSNTQLSESFCPRRAPVRELSEFLSAYYLCAQANSPSFSQNSLSLPQKLSEAQ